MRTTRLSGVALLLLLSATAWAGDGDDAISVYKTGEYKRAIPLLQAAVASAPRDPVVHADLLSALVYEGRVDEAADAAAADATAFPDSPEVLAARGEFEFYMGDIVEAERLFKDSFHRQETARANYGLYRVYRGFSMFRRARLLCLKAHELDPDDALISVAFFRYVIPEKRRELLASFAPAHPWFYKDLKRNEDTAASIKSEIKGEQAFEIEGGPKEITVPLLYLRNSPTRIHGVGIDLAIEGGRHLRMLLDTGATGILLSQAAVDRAGLKHLGAFEASGIGDGGSRSGFAAVAESCSIGALEFKRCIFGALEGKGRMPDDSDGLIGADFFSDYIVQMDFQRRTLHLKPQPTRPRNPQGYDREIPSDETAFTPIFRYGHELLIPTKVNGKRSGLFLLDTGAQMSSIDSGFARLSMKIHGDNYMTMKGISGKVKDVYQADSAELQFGHFRQRYEGLTAFNLNNSPEHREFRLDGILGIPVLSMFRLTIDYRNGLVNFDYAFK